MSAPANHSSVFSSETPIVPAEDFSPFDGPCAEICPPCCWRCMDDVSPLPITARYCPRCGAGLLDGAGRTLPIPIAAAAAAICPNAPIQAYTEKGRVRIATWLWLRAELARAAGSHSPIPPQRPGGTTQVVKGYANAMYHLGTRYESGLSAHRFAGEAARCFTKSARLGNDAAREKLGGAGA